MKRAYELDLSTCTHCGGPLRVLDVVLRPEVVERILHHLSKPTTRYGFEPSRNLDFAA